jgi:hypothetical protein
VCLDPAPNTIVSLIEFQIVCSCCHFFEHVPANYHHIGNAIVVAGSQFPDKTEILPPIDVETLPRARGQVFRDLMEGLKVEAPMVTPRIGFWSRCKNQWLTLRDACQNWVYQHKIWCS